MRLGLPLTIESSLQLRKDCIFVAKNLLGCSKKNFKKLIGGCMATPTTVEVVMGRTLQVPFGANGCAYF